MTAPYSIPITPDGQSSVVHGPPWHFSMDCFQVDYACNPDNVRRFLPAPLVLDDAAPGGIQLAFCDASAVSAAQPDLHVRVPADANFLECLLKIRCRHFERSGFFVAVSWVTNDQSLVRGFLQGFPKRFGWVSMTRFDRLDQRTGGRFAAARLGGRVLSSDGISIYADHVCERSGNVDELPLLPFFLRRHLPSTETVDVPLLDGIVEPIVRDSVVVDPWFGSGIVSCTPGSSGFAPLLPTNVEACSRSFRSALTIAGVAPLRTAT